jgi:hypothetical protein
VGGGTFLNSLKIPLDKVLRFGIKENNEKIPLDKGLSFGIKDKVIAHFIPPSTLYNISSKLALKLYLNSSSFKKFILLILGNGKAFIVFVGEFNP